MAWVQRVLCAIGIHTYGVTTIGCWPRRIKGNTGIGFFHVWRCKGCKRAFSEVG